MMLCYHMTKECNGCMKCREPKQVMESEEGTPIYAGDEYYEINGIILAEDDIERYRKTAEGGEEDG